LSPTEQKRVISIDFGEKRIGFAITDPLRLFSYPLVTLQNDNTLLKKIGDILTEYECDTIILGFPVKENGEHTFVSELVLKFKEKLSSITTLPIVLVDERYSSSIAQQRIIESVKSKKKRRDKSLVDKNAACVILEDYLSAAKR
jgi:putative holliday junction resolvase